jgi:lipopolysaccharide biosynthesis protein
MLVNAVVAHFDPNSERSANWQKLLRTLRGHIQKGVVVSTGMSEDDQEFAKRLGYSVVIRSNIGYDFMSYAIGFDVIQGASRADKILFCNDSFFISDEEKFSRSLQELLEAEASASFLSSSTQITRHGQSYLFAIGRKVFLQRLFQEFLSSIRPQPTRLDVIFAYEIGLTLCLNDLNVEFSSIIDSREFANRLSSAIRNRGINPIHDYADDIELRCGIVKYERLLKNPLRLTETSRMAAIAQAAISARGVPMKVSYAKPQAVVICHCHYEEVVDELVSILDRLPDGSEIHITSSSPSVLTAFKTRWKRRHVPLNLLATENKGRDVLPFFTVLRLLNLGDNIPILKIHGKRSLYSPLGEKWRKDLLDQLLPPPDGVKTIVRQFENSPRLAMIGARGSYVSDLGYWGANQDRVSKFMATAGFALPASDDLGFFAGTMFWIRSQCANEMLSSVDFEQFEPERGERDGTYGHVLERAIPMALRSGGWTLLESGKDTDLSPDEVRARKLEYF